MIDFNEINNPSQFNNDDLDKGEKIIIKAVGVGGGGNNAVDHMYKEGIKNISFVNINTDRQALMNSNVPNRLVIGPGHGAGNDPNVGRELAEENIEKINAIFDDDTEMVFITAGMGGGTGTGAGPVVARVAKERGLLTIGIVTIPFLFEGKQKIAKALAGADEMKKYVDALLIINNERLIEIYSDCDFITGFAKADDTLTIAARSISELITAAGKVNLDFKDVNTTLRDGGSAIISTGYGEGDHRVTKAIDDALRSPLLKNRNIMSSKRLLFNIFFNPNAEEKFLMDEANELTEFINTINDVDVIWGMAYDESLGNKVKITILAAGFDFNLPDEEDIILKKEPKAKSSSSATPAPSIQDQIKKEYGPGVESWDKDRSRYVILSPDQMDDEEIIEYLEKNPTQLRDKGDVERVRNTSGTTERANQQTPYHGNSGNDRINFL
mgnify:CR=1 FL=1